ncbi:hypothetical protein ABHA01_15695 [Clostridium paraputrificum]|uniref:hypothetical protein n=1 Tax=Clostridium paraputrificum TaxID=29363 RepID=UPI00325B9839
MRYMKKNLIFSVIILVIGAGLLITGFIIEGSGNEVNPMFFGLGCGFGVAGLVNTIQAMALIKNPEKCEEIEMVKTEERTVFLRDKNNSMVYTIFIYVECLMVIITSFLGYRSISLILSFLLCAKLVTWMIVGTINGKKY